MRIFITIILLSSMVGFAQQDPNLRSDGFSPFWTNPASYGVNNNLSTHLIGKLQWTGLEGAPKLFMTNTEAYLHVGPSQDNPKVKFGTGIMYTGFLIGFQKTQILKIPINIITNLGKCQLGVGVGLGFLRNGFTSNWVPPMTTNDPLLPAASSQSKFDMDAGIFLNHKNFYVGISSTHLFQPLFSEINFQSARHYYLQGGCRFKVGEHHIVPQVNLKADGASILFWNLNYFQFKEDIFSIGAGFGMGRELLLAATYRFKAFKIAYNFDLNFGPLSNQTSGSHELRLSLVFPKSLD